METFTADQRPGLAGRAVSGALQGMHQPQPPFGKGSSGSSCNTLRTTMVSARQVRGFA